MNGRHQILNDEEFWLRLEYEASAWLELSDDPALRRFWVDGFVPELATNTKRGIDAEGAVWIGEGGRNQYQYRFVAALPQNLLHKMARRFHIESLSLHLGQQFLEIVVASGNRIAEPGAAPRGSPAEPLRSSGIG